MFWRSWTPASAGSAILGYDDLLIRLADALEADDSPARIRMHRRWPIVMVDEFQDTDPVQWQVIDRAFSGRSTVILIGDPKQAIYAFRGGDIVTYLQAARDGGRQADPRHQLAQRRARWSTGCRWCCAAPNSATRAIVVHDVDAHHRGSRLAGCAAATIRSGCGWSSGRRSAAAGFRTSPIDDLRDAHRQRPRRRHPRAAGQRRHVQRREAGGPRHRGDRREPPGRPRLPPTRSATPACPSVYTGDSDVFGSEAAEDWLCLLEAFDQPHRSGVVRAAAATMFFGETAETLAAGGDALTDRVAETLREWAGHARERGVAAIFEAAQLSGMGDRVLSWQGGERHMTDLAHMTQLLQEAAHREHYNLPALRDWLRTPARRAQWRNGTQPPAGQRRGGRADHDGVGEQGPAVSRSCICRSRSTATCRNATWCCSTTAMHRCLHVGGKDSPDYDAVAAQGRKEQASDDSRLTYVAMTRAQSQVVAWWSPAYDEPNGGLSRLLRGREPGESAVPDRCVPAKISDDDAMARLQKWEAAGGPVIEESVVAPPARGH